MSDLGQRLHTFWPNGFDQGDVPKICEEAADRIEELGTYILTLVERLADYDGRIEALEAALREITSKFSEHSTAGAIARRALEGKHE